MKLLTFSFQNVSSADNNNEEGMGSINLVLRTISITEGPIIVETPLTVSPPHVIGYGGVVRYCFDYVEIIGAFCRARVRRQVPGGDMYIPHYLDNWEERTNDRTGYSMHGASLD